MQRTLNLGTEWLEISSFNFVVSVPGHRLGSAAGHLNLFHRSLTLAAR